MSHAERPDHDQMYLARALCSETARPLSPRALQALNTRYGRVNVTNALREIRGFPPAIPIRNLYVYIVAVCERHIWEKAE